MSRFGSESEVVEYKESLSEREAAGSDICAFANKRGGTLYFGVQNNGSVRGLSGTITEKTLRELTQYYYDNLEPRVVMDIDHEMIEELDLIKITIRPSSQPYHTFRGRPYIRVGPTSKHMSQDEYQRRLLLYMSTNIDYSSTLLPDQIRNQDTAIFTGGYLLRELKREGLITMDGSPRSIFSSWLLTKNGQEHARDTNIEVSRSKSRSYYQ